MMMALVNDTQTITNMPMNPIITFKSAPSAITTAPPTAPTIIVNAPIKPEAVPAFADAAPIPPMVAFATVNPFENPNKIQGNASAKGVSTAK